MKILRVALAAVCLIILLKVGVQVAISLAAIVVVIEFGPDRLRRLPRRIRKDGAVHLLVMLVAASVAMALSVAGSFIENPQKAMLASLASWLFVAAIPLIAIFHVLSSATEGAVVDGAPVKFLPVSCARLPRAS